MVVCDMALLILNQLFQNKDKRITLIIYYSLQDKTQMIWVKMQIS